MRLAGMIVGAWVALVFIANAPAQGAGEATIKIVSKTGIHAFVVELATNEAERSRGLMFRKKLPRCHGMLFDFEQDRPVAFWMRNTYLSLDMISSPGAAVSCALRKMPSRSRTASSPPALRFAPCLK
jgi:uncharacterized protein